MKISLGKFIHFKLPCLFIFFFFVLLYISGTIYWIFTENYLAQPSLLELNKCPACFGESFCETLFENRIQISRTTVLSFLDVFNSNSHKVYFATLNSGVHDNTKIVIKRLGKNYDLGDLDALICSKSLQTKDCDIATAIAKLPFVRESQDDATFAKYLRGTSNMFYCPSTRLVSELFNKYKERSSLDHVTVKDKIKIWSTSIINQEPLVLQIFSSSDGWPFPQYLGACGRFIATENGGEPLSKYYTAEWGVRVDLAYQLLKIAEQLTTRKEEFALYLTEIAGDKFAVDEDGKLTLVDLKDVLVVDKVAVRETKLPGWNDVHESIYAECPDQNFKSCHSFSEVQLCSHMTSDHNYYAICRYILTAHVDNEKKGQGQTDGLLHDIPETVNEEWDLEYLLSECVSSNRQRGRLQVVHKIIEALDNLR